MTKKHRVVLSVAEREQLLGRVHRGRGSAQALAHARILLKADEGADGVRGGRTSGLRRRSTSAFRPWSGCASGMRPRGLRRRCSVEHCGPTSRGSSMVPRKRSSSPSPARHRRRVGRGGACGCWPGGWWRCTTSSTGFRTRRSARTLKKRAEAVVEGPMVHPAQAERRVRLADGGRAGCVLPSIRSSRSPSLHGRDEQAAPGEVRPPEPVLPGHPPTSTTSTDDSARPTSSCSASRCVAGDR